jgi:hypothetical protein
VDFIVQDDSDGKGPYIAAWNVKDASGIDVPQPTDADLQAAWDAMQPSAADLLAAAQAAKKQDLSDAIAAKITAGYAYPTAIASTGKTYTFATTLPDQQNMIAARVWSNENPTQPVGYRISGTIGRVTFTRDEFVAVSTNVFDRVNFYLDQADVWIPQIYAADATADSVNAIVITIADPS